MRELLPLSAYERLESIPRLGLWAAVLWFVGMTIWEAETSPGALIFILAATAIGALVFWLFFTAALRWYMRRVIRQLYDGTSPWMPPAPTGQFDARLACSVMRGRIAVGGSLIHRAAGVGVRATQEEPFGAPEAAALGAPRAIVPLD